MGYYFSVWGILVLLIVVASVIAGWIFVIPERITQWSGKIPEFSVTVKDGILTETGLPQEPSTLVDQKDFIIFVSKTLTEIPAGKERKQGIYILKDHASIIQSEGVGEKEQKIKYTDAPELKNAHFDRILLSQKIVAELPTIKRIVSMFLACMIFFVASIVAIWYCAWSFFWGLFVWLFSRKQTHPFTYEQAVGFVLSVFFPVLVVAIIIMILGISFPFSMTILFLGALGYNHLSFHSSK